MANIDVDKYQPARSTPGDEERKQRVLDNGLACLRRLHGDQTWEDWRGVGAAMMVVTENVLNTLGLSEWDGDNKRLTRTFTDAWEQYELRLGSNHKPFSKQERWALREVMTKPEIEAWRSTLVGPEQRKLNHPNAVINKWKTKTKPKTEGSQQRRPSATLTLQEQSKEIEQLKARNDELTEELAGARTTASAIVDASEFDIVSALRLLLDYMHGRRSGVALLDDPGGIDPVDVIELGKAIADTAKQWQRKAKAKPKSKAKTSR